MNLFQRPGDIMMSPAEIGIVASAKSENLEMSPPKSGGVASAYPEHFGITVSPPGIGGVDSKKSEKSGNVAKLKIVKK